MGRKLGKILRKGGLSTKDELKDAVSFLNKLSEIDKLSKKDIKKLENIKDVLSFVLEKYDVICDLFENLEAKEIKIPIDIFVSKLTILESVVKYLKEEKNLSFRDIGLSLKRNERNIWHAYDNAKKKHPAHIKSKISEILIPVSIFENRDLSVFEALVFYLKADLSLRLSEIASLLDRDARTIWTVWSRAKKKNAK